MKTAKDIAETWFHDDSVPTVLSLTELLHAYGEQVKEECMKMVEASEGDMDFAIFKIRDLKLP